MSRRIKKNTLREKRLARAAPQPPSPKDSSVMESPKRMILGRTILQISPMTLLLPSLFYFLDFIFPLLTSHGLTCCYIKDCYLTLFFFFLLSSLQQDEGIRTKRKKKRRSKTRAFQPNEKKKKKQDKGIDLFLYTEFFPVKESHESSSKKRIG